MVLGHGARERGRVVGELRDQQRAHVRVHHQLLVAHEVERAVGIGLAVRRGDVHLAEIVRQAAQHGQADSRDVAAAGRHERAIESHGGDRVAVGLGTGGLGRRQQQLHHRMQRQVGCLAREARAVRAQHGRERRVGLEQLVEGIQQRDRRDAVLRHQAALERLAQLAIEQLALQRGGHRLVAGPQLDAGDVEDVGRRDDPLGLARLQDGGQRVRVGAPERSVVVGQGRHGGGFGSFVSPSSAAGAGDQGRRFRENPWFRPASAPG